jgi:SWI/SNF-related matrix-associated actin-dependent regulator of chromatin subfamily D
MKEGLYDKLQRIEQEVNRLCLQKRLSIEAEYMKRIKCKKSLRCFLKVSTERGLFFRLDSRVINDYKNGGELKFSDVVKRFCVVFDSDLVPTIDTYMAESSEFDTAMACSAIEVEEDFHEWAKGDEEVAAFEVRSRRTPGNVKLIFELENPREIYRLSPGLSKLLMKCTETKPNLITGIWKYSHRNGLIFPGSDLITSNAELKKLLGADEFRLADLSHLVLPHLCPLDYLVVDVPIIDGYSEIFDVPFEWDDLYQHPSIFTSEIHAMEKKIVLLRQLRDRCKERKKTLTEFHRNPHEFINRWMCTDSSDACYRSSLYHDKDVQQSVFDLLKKLG